MFTKHELKRYLEEISEGAKFLKFEYTSMENFIIVMKCRTEEDQTKQYYIKYAAEWVRKFSKFTSTMWIVKECFGKLQRILFRKVFACHRSSHNKKKRSIRNQDCKALIDLKVKFVNRNTKRNDPFLKEGLNATFMIKFDHSHKLHDAVSLHLLKSSSETDDIFLNYLDNGYSRNIAKCYHELTLREKYGSNSKYLCNSTTNPTLRHITYIDTTKSKGRTKRSIEDVMSEKKKMFLDSGGHLEYTNNFNITIVMTQVMRTIQVTYDVESLVIDNTQVPNGPLVSFLYTPTATGALPLCCILISEENEAIFRVALNTAKTIYEKLLKKDFSPNIITTNDNAKAIRSVFTDSTVKISRASLCNEVWVWLCADDTYNKKRHQIMEIFHSLIRTSSEAAQNTYLTLKETSYMKESDKLSKYLDQIWDKRDQWLQSSEPYNINVELSIRFMKELIVTHCKSFPVSVMVDVVSNIIDRHIIRVLKAFLDQQQCIDNYTKILDRLRITSQTEVDRVDEYEFRVTPIHSSLTSKKQKYTFRTDTWCCDCLLGSKGHFCEHLCGILNSQYVEIRTDMSHEDRLLLSQAVNAFIDKCTQFEHIEDNISEPMDDIKDGSVESCIQEVKEEYHDPLDEPQSNDQEMAEFNTNEEVTNIDIPNTSVSKADFKTKYETTLRALNDEFRRLSHNFRCNPNQSNMGTMAVLARELSKIRPVQKINFDNIFIVTNEKDS